MIHSSSSSKWNLSRSSLLTPHLFMRNSAMATWFPLTASMKGDTPQLSAAFPSQRPLEGAQLHDPLTRRV